MTGVICFCSPLYRPIISSSSSFVTQGAKGFSRQFRSLGTFCARRPKINETFQMAAGEEKPTPKSDRNDGRATSGMFGIRLQTNGDVIKFGVIAIAVAYAIKSLLQLLGTPDLLAGQLTTAFVSVFSLLAWVSTYVFRVGTKGMTYAQQLRDYEDEVIKKRYEELTDEELTALGEELDDDI